ncbi:glycosyltransferase family 39 protein [Candidatus Dojkabacteria bacterium]|nr:glycosyltransferase family 39 protein [Candidatus Dojkabacteria bacterium]
MVTKRNILFLNIFIFTVIIIAFFLRIVPAFERDIIFDEAFTISHLIKLNSVEEIVNADPSVPPLNYLMVKFLAQFSNNVIFIRICSVLFSISSLILIYYWMRRYSRVAAAFSLILLSFSSYMLFYSWQAYVYSQLLFLSLTSTFMFYKIMYEKVQRLKIYLIIFVVSTLASFFTHYSYIWTIVGFIFVWIFERLLDLQNRNRISRQRSGLGLALSIVIFTILAYLPVILNRLSSALTNVSWMQPVSIYSIGQATNSLLGYFDNYGPYVENPLYRTVGYLLGILVLCLSIIVSIIAVKRNYYRSFILFANFLIIITIMFPFLVSYILGSSIFAIRSMQLGAVFITCVLSLYFDKLFRLHEFGRWLVISTLIISILVFFRLNRNTEPVLQEQDVAKYYAEWLVLNTKNMDLPLNIFFFNRYSPIPHIDTEQNHVVFDYYWDKYLRNNLVKSYRRITQEDLKNGETNFYLATMRGKTDDVIDDIGCINPKVVYTNPDRQYLKLYKCSLD